MDEQLSAQGDGRIWLVVIEPADAGQRLDRILAQRFQLTAPDLGLSRARLQVLIEAGAVLRDREPVSDASHKVRAGDTYRVILPQPEPAAPSAQPMPLNIVYEDRDVIVIDKPSGLVVHPGAGHADGTLVNALIAHCGDGLSGIGGVRRPGIVHRLDKDTSGLLVVAKSDVAHQRLAEQFQAHGADGRLERRYQALVWGVPRPPRGTIDAPLGRSTTNRTKIAVSRRDDARSALTHFRIEQAFGEASLLELSLETGRTHQIRVHLAYIGHPVIGDPVYASGHRTRQAKLPASAKPAAARLRRQALHAYKLGFEHPKSGKKLIFESHLPADMADLLVALQG
jgi:23S rRNA pseudouridine1911/1915/1917 synthase